MTVGNINRSVPPDVVDTKVWSGSDGKTTENPYSVLITQTKRIVGTYMRRTWDSATRKELTRTPWPLGQGNFYLVSGYPLLALPANVDLAALSKLETAIRGHNFNLAVTGAESKQTLELLVNSVRSFFTFLSHVRKGRAVEAVKQLRFSVGQQSFNKFRKRVELGDLSGALLAVRYGWQPLLKDIYELMKAIEQNGSKRQVTFRGRSTYTTSADLSPDPYNPARTPCLGQQTVGVTYKVIYTETLSKARELGLLDPATVLWEKMGYSFVVDWFIPIYTYLSALSFLGNLNAKALKTVYQETTIALVNQSHSIPPLLPEYGHDWIENEGQIGRKVQVVRTYGDIVVPKPEFKSLAKALSLTHLENAAALIHQLVIGGKPTKYAGRH